MTLRRAAIWTASVAAFACATAATKGPLEPFAAKGITDAAGKGRRFALLVGIDRFEDTRFSPLRYAGADAQALGKALAGFDEVHTLTRPEETSRAAILEAFAEMEKRIRSPQDALVVYFSTHGSLDQQPGGALRRYLVASDTRMDLLSETGISVDALAHKADALLSRRVALILATCHSGKGKSTLSDALARALASHKAGSPPPLEEVSEAVVVLTAASFGEAAREDESLGHDVYTYFFLQALDEGDLDGDGAVTATEAHDYARERTYAFTNGEQRPTAESSILGKDPIVLRGERVRAGKPVVYSYSPSARGLAVSVNGVSKGTLPGGIVLDPGSYRLRLTEEATGRLVFEGGISLAPGERIELSRLIPRPPRAKARLSAGLFMLTSGVKEIPTSVYGGLRGEVEDWPLNGISLEAELSLLTGSGEESTFSGPIPYRATGVHVAAAALFPMHLGSRITASPGFGLGTLWMTRSLRAQQFSSDESLRATTTSALLDLGWLGFDPLELSVRVELLAVFASLAGSSGPHMAIVTTLGAGVGF